MTMWKHDHFQESLTVSFTFFLLVAGCGFRRAVGATIGVNYGQIADNLPPPAEVVTLLQSISITQSKLYDADPVVLQTFGNTGVSFIVGTFNNDLLTLTNPSAAVSWVQTNIVSHLPATHITGIVVGNEIFSGTDTNMMSQVLPAMLNVYSALKNLGLHHQIFVSTAHSFGTLSTSFPPSAGAFNPAIANLYIKPVLDFLVQTSAPFLINVYPFFAYKDNPTNVSLQYVLFQTTTGIVDENTGLHYYNMFDAQMDSVYSAISALGYTNVTLLVSETGWPSAGDTDEPGANITNAQTYHQNLVDHVTSKKGTPLRPDTTPEVYLFALFNEDLKNGPTSERNYGLFYPNGSKVYEFSFSQSASSSAASCLQHPSITLAFIATLMYFYCMGLSILTNSNSF